MAKAQRGMFTAAELREWLRYDPATGHFTWLQKASSRAMPGYRAGCLDRTSGYWVIKILKRQCKASRLAWLYMTGEWPEDEVDHKNTARSDNRWSNLRPGNRSTQLANQRPRSPHKKGIYLRKSGRWMAQVQCRDIRLNLGTYNTEDEAHEAYRRAATKLHGEFARFE